MSSDSSDLTSPSPLSTFFRYPSFSSSPSRSTARQHSNTAENVNILHLQEQLRECRTKIKNDKDFLENIKGDMDMYKDDLKTIRETTKNLLIQNSQYRAVNDLQTRQLSRLKSTLQLKYEEIFDKLERCGAIKFNPDLKSKSILELFEKCDIIVNPIRSASEINAIIYPGQAKVIDDIDKVLEELQQSIQVAKSK